ncbi:MAG: hypothetical protein IJV06_01050 [Bacteroidaceae bacterium]|nr:hypothetical protein [Bacteroidaceae bacterium]
MVKKLLFMVALAAVSIAARGAETWWGYWNPEQGMEAKGALSRGANDMAVFVPQGHPLLGGSTVKAVRFWLSDKTAVIRLRVWISTKVFDWSWGRPDIALQEVNVADVLDMDHDGEATTVYFDEPATLPQSGAYIGFSVTLGSSYSTSPCEVYGSSDGGGTKHGFYYMWGDMYSYMGNLAMQALVSSDGLAEYSVSPSGLGTQTMARGTDRQLSVTLTPTGTEPVKTVGYVLTVGDTELAEREYTLPEGSELTAYLAPKTVTLPVDLPLSAEAYATTLSITKVNGQPNASAQASTAGSIVLLERLGTRRSVMEEFTGTWCTWCPRGIVGMRRLEEEFGDRFIGIAVHIDDLMQVGDYARSRVKRMASGLPNSVIDRTVVCDPYGGINNEKHFSVNQDLARALAVPAVADLGVEARWSEQQTDVIEVGVQTTFWYTDFAKSQNYSIALVLVEDGMKGEGTGWQQANRYAQANSGYDDDDMAEFRNAPHYITDIAYNHVAVAVAGIDNGLGGIEAPILNGQLQLFSYQWDLSQNTLIQDRSKLSVVALLLNPTKGTIENAAKVKVSGGSSTGIAGIKVQEGTQPTDYSINGQQLAQPQRGVNIRRMADGTVQKVVVK